jgi:hypothetical protein
VATYKRSRDWPRARGSISEVAKIARAAHAAVDAIPHEGGDDPSLSITVEMPGVEDRFTSEAEFTRGVADYPLSRLAVTINASTGFRAASDGLVLVYLGSAASGARMHVSGSDRRWVDGTAAIIREAVQGVALRPRSWRAFWVALLVVALLMWAAEGVGLTASRWTDHSTAVVAAAGAVFALSAAYVLWSIGLLGRVVRRFRLVGDDVEDPRDRRLRLVRRATVTVLVLVVGAVISALVNKWID